MKRSAVRRAQEAGMNNQATHHHALVTLVLLALPFAASAQVPVDEDGNAVASYETAPDDSVAGRATGNEDIPLLSAAELEELVGPVALYPDDLLAIVLPAAAYPMQLIEASEPAVVRVRAWLVSTASVLHAANDR